MDSVTQIALGASVGGLVAGSRIGRSALLIGAALGCAPDFDVFVPFDGAVESFTYHRSFSHSLIVLTLLCPALVVLLRSFTRLRMLSLGRSALFVWLTLVTHAALDAFTVYGTQLFWPISDYPVSGSSIFIIDPLYTILLFAGIIALWCHATRGVQLNRLCLGLSCVYLCWSVVSKHHIERSVEKKLLAQGVAYERLLTTPMPFNTLGWRFVAMQPQGYLTGFASVLDPSDSPLQINRFESDQQLLNGLSGHWPVQRLQRFTHGFYKVSELEDKVVMTDLRMGVEGAYIFNFVVGIIDDGSVVPVKSKEVQLPRDYSAFGTLMKRIIDPDVIVPVGYATVPAEAQ